MVPWQTRSNIPPQQQISTSALHRPKLNRNRLNKKAYNFHKQDEITKLTSAMLSNAKLKPIADKKV